MRYNQGTISSISSLKVVGFVLVVRLVRTVGWATATTRTDVTKKKACVPSTSCATIASTNKYMHDHIVKARAFAEKRCLESHKIEETKQLVYLQPDKTNIELS
jgi:hypothetical protein